MNALVIGGGFAADAHVQAMAHVGVRAAAVWGRRRAGIVTDTGDLDALADQVRPDVLVVTTPAGFRPIALAARLGVPVVCEKPLATSVVAADAWVAATAGRRTAFAATRRYEPSVVALADAVRAIGPVRTATYTMKTAMTPPLAYGWPLVVAQGGGLLFNAFPHVWSIVERVLGGPVVSARGRVTATITRAPVLPPVADFRAWRSQADDAGEVALAAAPWVDCDADGAYEAELVVRRPDGDVPVRVVSGEADFEGWRITGDGGAIEAPGVLAFTVGGVAPAPGSDAGVIARCTALWEDFVHGAPLTLADGARLQRVIAAIRSGPQRVQLPDAQVKVASEPYS